MKNLDLLKNIKNQGIALIGHMGSGKSIIGKLIAKDLKYKLIDTDSLIENNENKTINQIFELHGEAYFRNIEENTIISIKNHYKLVLSLGGGAITSNLTRKYLKENFTTIFLDTDLPVLKKRLEKSIKRPLLKVSNIEKKIKELDIERRKYYLLADIIIKNNNNSEETLNEFKFKYKKLNEKNN